MELSSKILTVLYIIKQEGKEIVSVEEPSLVKVCQRSGALSAGKEFDVLWEASFCKRILISLISE